MKRIETHRPAVPWSWVAWMVIPWLPQVYSDWCGMAPLLFTVRKFADDPTLIAFLTSIHVGFNFLIGGFTSYLSDRVWTRWGRRRPFLIPGWIGMSVAMMLVPLAPNLLTLSLAIVLWQFCFGFAKPYEPLYNEVIPPPQRGRASVLRNIMQNITSLFFNGVLLAQYDRTYGLDVLGRTFRLNGEMMIYWVGGLGVLFVALFLAFRVKETPPLHHTTSERFNVRVFVRDLFGHRQWWMLYLLFICPALMGGGLPGFAPLFQTEQLGFTKEQLGMINMVSMLAGITVFVPLAGFLTDKDKISRIRMFQIGLIVPPIVNLLFFFYVRFVAHFSISYATLLGFNLVAGANVGLVFFVWVVQGPLLYDYIPSNHFGTVSAGFSFVSGLVSFLLVILGGVWVKAFTALFGSGGGWHYDYSSTYIFQFCGGVVAFCLSLYFEREVKRGRIIPYAQLELDEARRVAQTTSP